MSSNPKYLGEVFYIDIFSRQIVAKGYGYVDREKFKLAVDCRTITEGAFQKLAIVVKTSDGYLSPFALYGNTLHKDRQNTSSYDMRAYLQWPTTYKITHFLEPLSAAEIVIKSRHLKDSTSSIIYTSGVTEELTQKTTSTHLGDSAHRGCTISVGSGFIISRPTEKSRQKIYSELKTLLTYRFSHSDKTLSFTDIGSILLAFRLYWICYFDQTDCEIDKIKLSSDITLNMSDNFLPAKSINNPGYRSSIRLVDNLHLRQLAKMANFFLNPTASKKIGASSKIGLAFTRIIDYRFHHKPELANMDIASLIFALQSLSEGVAEREIQKANQSSKEQTIKSISCALKAIRAINDKLAPSVSQFYNRTEREIYSLISRPTFMKSLEVSLEKLGIDIKDYHPMLKSIDSARRQIVHSEGYSADFILSLLTQTVSQLEVGAKNKHPSSTIDGVSEIDKLYELLRLMTIGYFEK